MFITHQHLSIEGTQVLFLNHASVLIKSGDHYLLTDPWHQSPAFGSWLPSFPQYVHPSYLAALGDRLVILISHGHDDHCDDKLLTLFDRGTKIVTADFKSPSVEGRVRRIGFYNIIKVGLEGIALNGPFRIRAYIDESRSPDDAIYSIDCGDGVLVHANDNWSELPVGVLETIKTDILESKKGKSLLMSQTNSASGFPLTYRGYGEEEKKQLLKSKVRGMVMQGLRNAEALGIEHMVSYAGYATVFVKNHPEYQEGYITDRHTIITELLNDDIGRELLAKVDVLDYVPGDLLHLSSGSVYKSPIAVTSAKVVDAAKRYFELYGVLGDCDTYKDDDAEIDVNRLDYFLKCLNEFGIRKAAVEVEVFGTIIGKSLEIIVEDSSIRRRLKFGEGLVVSNEETVPNKRMIVKAAVLAKVLIGRILLENLYTGYEAEWDRFPREVYNRDLVLLMVMFSYVFKNRLANQFQPAIVES